MTKGWGKLCETSVPQISRVRGLGGLGCAAGSQIQAGFASNEEFISQKWINFSFSKWEASVWEAKVKSTPPNPWEGCPGATGAVQIRPCLCSASFMFPVLCLSRWHLAAFQQVPSVLTASMSNAVYLCTLIRVQRPDIKHQSIGPNLLWVLSPHVYRRPLPLVL